MFAERGKLFKVKLDGNGFCEFLKRNIGNFYEKSYFLHTFEHRKSNDLL